MVIGEDLVTIKEVLELSGVSRHTLYRDTRAGKIPAIYFGRMVRYRKSDAEKYAEEKNNSDLVMIWKKKKESEFTQQKN